MLLTLLLCVVIMTVGIILTAMLNRSLNTLLSGQMEQETEEYKNRILQQIDKDFQTLQTLSAFVGDNSFTDSEEFAASLWDANRQNEFLIMAYFNRNEDGVLMRPEEDAIENVELGELGEVLVSRRGLLTREFLSHPDACCAIERPAAEGEWPELGEHLWVVAIGPEMIGR